MAAKKPVNPFYLLLVLAGAAFSVSACAYGVMTFRELNASYRPRVAAAEEHPLMGWFRTNGERLLIGELIVLAIGTVGAIATDGYWSRRADASNSRDPASPPNQNTASKESSHESHTA